MSPPKYIKRGGELVFEPPFKADKVDYYGFILDADINKLTKVCDDYLNTPLGGSRFTPAGAFVLLACCNLHSLRSSTAPYSDWGWFAEKEIAFWMLVVDKKVNRLYWLLPYIWVDNPYAMAMGRELYGFPKGIGIITLPTNPDNTHKEFVIDTLVLPTYSANTEGTVKTLVEIKETSHKVTHKISGVKKDMETLVNEIVDELSLLDNVKFKPNYLEYRDLLLRLDLPMVFLKQIRDVVTPTNAAYQSIVKTKPTANNFHPPRIFPNNFDVNIFRCDSHPIMDELGLSAQGQLKSRLSFYVKFDFEIGKGTEETTPGQ